jgi:hypothetical protein
MQLNLCPLTATFQRTRKEYYCQEVGSEGGLSYFWCVKTTKPDSPWRDELLAPYEAGVWLSLAVIAGIVGGLVAYFGYVLF